MTDCYLGLIEHDGFQYCFIHGGFYHNLEGSRICNRADQVTTEEEKNRWRMKT